MKICLILILTALSSASVHAYKTSTEKCYLTKLIPSLSDQNKCIGLVADQNNISWVLPRKILFVEDSLSPQNFSSNNSSSPETSTAIVTAMGSWKKNQGQIWKIKLSQGKLLSSELLFKNTDRSHGIALGNKDWIYYADSTKIYRFKMSNPIATREIVLSGLPDSYTDRNNQTKSSNHPLKEIVFLDNWELLINIGAPSNDCNEEYKKFRACHQRDQQAEIRKYTYNSSTDSYSNSNYTVIARGLRNSMGLLYNPMENEVYQAENAADNFGTPDELNVINPYKSASIQDFGWPFCFGSKNVYKGYSRFLNFCQNTSLAPFISLPAHVAPLDIKYYSGNMFKNLKNSILMSWHGHRPSGSKIAIYETDKNLRPDTKYSISERHQSESPIQLITSRWEKPETGHPKGRPVGIGIDEAGAIFIIDDVNNSLLVVAQGSAALLPNTEEDSSTVSAESDLPNYLTQRQMETWPDTLTRIKNFDCQSCHGDIFTDNKTETLLNLINNNWINPKSKILTDQLIWLRITGYDGAKIMPPSPSVNMLSSPDDLKAIEAWIQFL